MINKNGYRFTAKLLVFVLAANPLLLAAHGAERAFNIEPERLSLAELREIQNQYQRQNDTRDAQNSNTGTRIQLAQDQQAALKASADGITVVDIAAPSQHGVSHNQFSHLNVPQQGAIFNNSNVPYVSVLGGWTDGNRRLTGGTAELILAEVTGANRSDLLGITEILGDAAEFVIANPNGITCNGCGFINTPRVMMTTGLPGMVNGEFATLNVTGGDIKIDGAGLNASNITKFDILSRAVKVNAVLQANELSVSTGVNIYDVSTGQLTSAAAENVLPADYQFALDVSELGGMYASNIRLIGTEAGLGIRNAGLIKSANDLTLTADGRLELNHTIAANQLIVTSRFSDIDISGTAFAATTDISAHHSFGNTGLIAASETMSIKSQTLSQNGDLIAGINSEGDWLGNAFQTLSVKGALNNSGRIVSQGQQNIQSGLLSNATTGLIQAGSSNLTFDSGINDGTLLSDELHAISSSFKNSGDIYAKNISLNIGDFEQMQGGVYQTDAAGTLNIDGSDILLEGGVVVSQGTAIITADTLFNNAELQFEDDATIATSILTNSGTVITSDNTSVTTEAMTNSEGATFYMGENASIEATNTTKNQGDIRFSGSAVIKAQSIDNEAGSLVQLGGNTLTLTASQNLNNKLGEISTTGLLEVSAPQVNNKSGVMSGQNVEMEGERLVNTGGLIDANHAIEAGLSLSFSQSIENTEKGRIQASQGGITLTTQSLDNTAGIVAAIETNDALTINATQIDNYDGTVSSDATVTINTDELENENGAIFSNSSLLITSNNFIDNSHGTLSAKDLEVAASSIKNTGGLISAQSFLTLMTTQEINNSNGTVSSAGSLQIESPLLINQGEISAAEQIVLTADVVENQSESVISAESLVLNTDQLTNKRDARIEADHLQAEASYLMNNGHLLITGETSEAFTLNSDSIINTGRIENHSKDFNLQSAHLSNEQGKIYHLGTGVFQLEFLDTLQNTAGSIHSGGSLEVVGETIVNHQGSIQAGRSVKLLAQKLDNSFGKITSDADVTAVIDTFDNSEGLVQATSILDIAAGELNNNNGELLLLSDTAKRLNLNIQGTLDNTGATVHSRAQKNVIHAQLLQNAQGELSFTSNAAIDANLISNQQGSIVSEATLQIDASEINSSGTVAARNLFVDAQQVDNVGRLQAQDGISMNAGKFINTGDLAAQTVVLQTQSFDNAGLLRATADVGEALYLRALEGSVNTGSIVANGDALKFRDAMDNTEGEINYIGAGSLQFAQLNNQRGNVYSSGKIQVVGNTDNRSGMLQSVGGISVSSTILDNSTGIVKTQGNFNAKLKAFDNRNGELHIGGGESAIHVEDALLNSSGQIVSSSRLHISAQHLDGGTGIIAGKQDLSLDTSEIYLSEGGAINATDSLQINADALHNGGEISAQTTMVDSTLINNSQGLIQAGDSLSVEADYLNNQSGTVVSLGNADLNLNSYLDGQSLANQGGQIVAGSALTLLAQGAIDNTSGGTIQADSTKISAGSVDNTLGIISAGQGLSINADDAINNHAGRLQSDTGALLISAATVLNSNEGKMLQGNDGVLDITSYSLINSGVIDGSNVALNVSDTFTNAGYVQGGLINVAAQYFANTGQITGEGIDLTANTLTNKQGTIASTGVTGLKITGQTINNTDGLIQSSTDLLSLDGQVINEQGVVLLQDDGTLNVAALINNQNGEVVSGGDIYILHDLNNQNGTVQAHSDLEVGQGTINNVSGTLHAGNDLQVNSDHLTNQNGQISAGGKLHIIATADIDNASAGMIVSEGQTVIEAAKIYNESGRIESKGNVALLASDSVDNTAGFVLSDALISIETGDTVINDQGVIAAAHLNTSTDSLSNLYGEILAFNSATLTAQNIDNTQGGINATYVTVSAAEALSNLAGTIKGERVSVLTPYINNTSGTITARDQSADALTIASNVTLVNDQGVIASNGKHLTLHLSEFSNENGQILHYGSADFHLYGTSALTNSGIIAGAGNVDIYSTILSNTGDIQARGLLTVTGGLENQTGATIKANDIDILGQGNQVRNYAVISAQNSLQASAQSISNEGILFAQENAWLSADKINNSGTLSSHSVSLVDFNNLDSAGTIESKQTHISGDILTIGANGLLSSIGSGSHDLTLNVSNLHNAGTLLNNAQDMHVSGNLNNSGKIVHAGAGSLILGASGNINNAGGSIASAGTTELQSSISGHGDIYARNGLQINTSGTFTNYSDLYTAGYLQINSALNNVGSLLSEGDLSIATSGNVTNTGVLQGQNLSLSAATLNNDNGTITSLGLADAAITVSGLTNKNGSIEATNTNFWLTTSGQTFNNNYGQILHAGTGRLALTSAKSLLSSAGDITSSGTLAISANGTLSNHKGRLSADAIDLVSSGTLDNTSGIIKASGTAASSVESAAINNTSGKINANSVSLTLATGTLDNTSGNVLLFGNGGLFVDAESVNNVNDAAFIGSGGTLSLKASESIYNSGRIGASGLFDISAALITNRNTLVSETSKIILDNTDTLKNTGVISANAGIDATVATLTNTGGKIQSDGNINITSNTLAVGEVTGQNVDIKNKNNIVIEAGETISAASNVALNSEANITNKGSIAANDVLNLTADRVTNLSTGRIKSQDVTQIDTGRLNNSGLIIGGSTVALTGDTVSNQGSIAAGRYLDITANVTNSEFLFAGTNLTLTGNLTNTANVYSHLNMTLSGSQITNKGGMISAVQDLTIRGTLNNTYSGTFDYVDGESTATKVYTAGQPHRAPTNYSDPSITWNTEYEENTTTVHLAELNGKQGTIVSGRDMTLDGKLTNNYSKIYAGRDLALKGASLTNNNAQNKEVSEMVVVSESWESSCLQGSYENNLYFCSEPGTSKKIGETILASHVEVTYIDGGNYGTIVAGRNISGNLKEQLELVDATPESAYGSGFDTSASGSKGTGTSAKTIQKQSKDSVQVNRQTGDGQTTPQAMRNAQGEQNADIPQSQDDGHIGNHGYHADAATSPAVDTAGANVVAVNVRLSEKSATEVTTHNQPELTRVEQRQDDDYQQTSVTVANRDTAGISTVTKSSRGKTSRPTTAANDDHHIRLVRDDNTAGAGNIELPEQPDRRPSGFASQMNINTGTVGALPDRKQEKGLVGNGTIASNTTHNPDLILKNQITNQEGNLAVARAQSQYNSSVANPFITAKQMQVLTDELNIDADVIRDGQLNLFSAISQDDLLEDGVTLHAGGTIDIAASSITNETGISGGEGLILRSEGAFNIGSLGFLDSDKLLGLELGGDFTNTLNLESENVWLDVGGQFINNANLTGTDTLTIAADKDIVNNTQLNGANIALDAGGDIINKTSFFQKTVNADNGNSLTYSWVDNVPQLNATESLTMNAGQNIDLLGTKLSVEGDIIINAENDVLLGAVESVSGHEKYFKGGHDIVVDRTYDVVELDAGNNLSISAGNNIESEGAQFGAGQTAALSAGNEMNLMAVVESHYDADKKTKKSFLKKKVTETVSHHDEVQGTTITAENILLNATVDSSGQVVEQGGGDITLEGGGLNASENIIGFGEDITLTAGTYQDYEYSHTSKSSFGGLKSKSREELAQDDLLDGSTLSAGGNIVLNAGNNLNILASELDGDNIGLTAFNDVLIASGEESSIRESRSQSGGFLSGGSLYSSTEALTGSASITADSSVINASGNIVIDAGSATVIGSSLDADEGIAVKTDIGDIQVLAAEERTATYSREEEVNVSLTDALKSLTRPDELIQSEDGQLKLSLGTATYDKVDFASESTSHKGSELNAGGSVSLDSVADVIIEGSEIAAAGNANLIAGGDVIVKEAEDRYSETREEIHGSAEMSVVVQHQAVEVAKATVAVDDAKDQVKQANADYRKYQKEKDQLENTLAQLEADYANGVAGVNHADIVELRNLLDDVKSDEEWYVAGMATAAANLASKTTLLVQQTAAAAQSTATYGFNAGVQLDVAANKTDSSLDATSSLASTVNGTNINVLTGGDGLSGNTLIQGSALNAAQNLNILTGELDVLASQDTQRSETDTQSGSMTIAQTVWGSAGGPTVNASLNSSKQQDQQTTHNNSTLTANNLNIATTGDTTIIGGNLHGANAVNMVIGGDLTLESVQDRFSGSNKGMGISGGMSLGGVFTNENGAKANSKEVKTTAIGQGGDVSSVNGGVNASNGRYQKTETVLSSITGGTVDVFVDGNAQLTGALLAAVDAEGNDTGNLSLSTDSLNTTDLTNRNYSSNQSVGVNASVGVSDAANPADPNQSDTDLALNSSNYSYQNKSSQSLDKTLATIGEGDITVDGKETELAGLNRSTENSANEIYNVDRQQGNIDLTVDHRLLSEDGHKQIKEDFKRTEILGESIFDTLESSVSLTGSGEVQDSLRNHIGNKQDYFTATKNFTQNMANAEHVATLSDSNATFEEKQAAYSALANEISNYMGVAPTEAKVLMANDPRFSRIAGAHSRDTDTVYVNDAAHDNASDAVNTIGHETQHYLDNQQNPDTAQTETYHDNREEYAGIMGDATEDYLDFNFAQNDQSLAEGNTHNWGATTEERDRNKALANENHASFRQEDEQALDYYLTKETVDKVKDCLAGATCSTAEQKAAVVADAEDLSVMLDNELNNVCRDNPTGDACRTSVNTATQYIGMEDAWDILEGDVSRSSKNTFDYVYNSDGAEENFDVYYNTIDNRADFFGASDQYEQNIGLGARWFGGAEFVSRAPLTGLGADGNGSWISFGVGGVITGTEVYDWRSEAGKTLMNAGFDNFKSLYNQEVSDPIAWDINQLKNEQRALQSVHKKYLGERTSFTGLSKFMTNTEVNPLFNETELSIDTKQGMPGGVDILNYKSRIEFGCKLMVYSASQGCQP